MNIYLLWTHGEQGPEELVATVDRARVIELAKSFDTGGWFARAGANTLDVLQELLERDAPVGVYNLMDGWGGLHFQIVEEGKPAPP